ncbi:acid-sensing ion channel 1A-like [Actinia tenebrosa]|uniref:Acid-sensing ion channel 1A-like n=1 Tax=Actinia tenebrosa TaxID=6105 RepID=A0A6P8IJ99_ACTTE|nr:acid-sensing ion channel 1A-like [Actinia tenebrosa]
MAQDQTKNAWSEQEIPKAETLSDIWKDFSGNSTLHGLKNAVLSRSVYLRVAWSLVVLSAFSYLLYSIIQSCNRYLEHGTTFQISQKFEESLIFPAITICPKSTADKKKLFALDTDQDFHQYGLNISACVATADVRAGIPCGYALLCACLSTIMTEKPLIEGCDESLQEKIIDALKFHNVQFKFEEFFLTFSQTWREMVDWCQYGLYESNCTAHFRPFINSDGICYIFNSNKTNASESYYPGVSGGLQIVLNAQLDRVYYPKFSEGFSVFVTEQSDFKSDVGINAGTGSLTSISLEVQKFKYQKHPYGARCGERKLKGEFVHYSYGACYAQCWSDHLYQMCGCRPAGYGDYFNFSKCDCPVACEVTKYNTEVSYGTLPHKSTAGVSQLFSANYSRENYAIIEIGFKGLSYAEHEEKLAFEKTSLLGEVGGNMGLLLGCSLLTLVEFIDLLFSLLLLRFKGNNVGVH